MSSDSVSVVETAKLVRDALAAGFPGQKLSVRASSYSGGAPLDRYADGSVANCNSTPGDKTVELALQTSAYVRAEE